MNVSEELFKEVHQYYPEVSIRHMGKCIGVSHSTLSLNIKGSHAWRAESWFKMLALLGALSVEEDGILIKTDNEKIKDIIREIAAMPLYDRR